MLATEHIQKMVGIFDQIGSLTEDLKTLKDESKAAGHNPAILAAIAKAKSDGNSGKLREKLESTLDIMDVLEG